MLEFDSNFFPRYLTGMGGMCTRIMELLARGLENQVKCQILEISEILRFLVKIPVFRQVMMHIWKQIEKISVGIGVPTHFKAPKIICDVWRAFMKIENRLKYGKFHQI